MNEFNETQTRYLNSLEGDELCNICRYSHLGCHGLSNTGNGPVFPRCSESEYRDFVDPVQLKKAMEQK